MYNRENMGDITINSSGFATGRIERIDATIRDIESVSNRLNSFNDVLHFRINSLQSRCDQFDKDSQAILIQIHMLQEDLRLLEKQILINFFLTLANTIIVVVLVLSKFV